jgi:hypothetical protein
MWAAGPAAWPPHPFLKLRTHSFDMLPPCLIFLDGDGPANPLVACERRYVFPCRPCLRVGCERRSEISGKIMYHTPGDSNGCYRSPRLMAALAHDLLKDQAPDTRVQLGFQGLSSPNPIAPFTSGLPVIRPVHHFRYED